jgi:hypothetical protein
VDLLQTGAIGAEDPNPIEFVPGTFVTKHQERRVRRGELDMIEPVGAPYCLGCRIDYTSAPALVP